MATLLAFILAAAAEPVRSAHAIIHVRAAQQTVTLRGRADFRGGYRFVGRDGQQVIFITRRRDGGFEQLLRSSLKARDRPIWVDDHPPSLPLGRRGSNPVGAETFAHLALLALTQATPGSATVDFASLYRRPDRYDDGRFVMRPFLRRVGTVPVTWRFDAGHRVVGLAFKVPRSAEPFRGWGRTPGAAIEVRLSGLDTVGRLKRPYPLAIE